MAWDYMIDPPDEANVEPYEPEPEEPEEPCSDHVLHGPVDATEPPDFWTLDHRT